MNRQSEFSALRPGSGDIRPVLAGDRMAALRTPSDELEPVAAPPPPLRSRQARNRMVVLLNGIVSLLVFAAVLACGVVYFGKLHFEEPGPLQEARTVIVREGSGADRIADQLVASGVIDSKFVFRGGLMAYRAQGSLKPGEYSFQPGVSMYEVMDTIRSGRGVIHKVTFPEGLTAKQIFDRLAADEVLVGELPSEVPVEGTLFPDTYPFQRGTTREDIIKQMMRANERIVSEVWAKRDRDLPISDRFEFVTLASIVEKETGKADERPRVAAVFLNRLKKGMRLQSDPTILYGLFGGDGKPAERSILQSDLEKPTPYNTYLITGLPPGPIANPGRAALEAVANPARTNDLYFVADGTGGHAFAETLDEHNENVRRWRIVEKRLQEEAARKAAEAAAAGSAGGDTVVQPGMVNSLDEDDEPAISQ